MNDSFNDQALPLNPILSQLLIQDTKQSSGESLAFKLPHLTSDKQDFEMPEHLIPHNQDKMQYEQQDLYNNPHMHHDTYSRLCNEKPSGLQWERF